MIRRKRDVVRSVSAQPLLMNRSLAGPRRKHVRPNSDWA
jgi:hypothetical protein